VPERRPLLSLRRTTLGYGRRVVLREIDLDIHAGELWCLLGPNGEGKTTLVKALLGALRPRSGTIVREPGMFRAGKVSYVPQRLELNPTLPMSVREFVLSGLAGIRTDASSRERRLGRVLELVGLTRSARQSVWALSGGQRQRASVARALVRDPSMLVVDEPTTGLDAASSAGVIGTLRELHAEYGVTIVLVTHDLATASRLATHVAFFRHGRVVAGSKDDVLTADHLQATFGVPSSVNRDEHGGYRVELQTGDANTLGALARHTTPEPSRDSER